LWGAARNDRDAAGPTVNHLFAEWERAIKLGFEIAVFLLEHP
jgi:hypothetical protein